MVYPGKDRLGKDSIGKDSIKRDDGSKKFVPPTLEEVESYIAEKGLSVEGKQFLDYFTVGNWVDAKGQKVKNWKQKLLTWNRFGLGTVNKPIHREKATFGDLRKELENDESGNAGHDGDTTNILSEILPKYDIS